MAFPLDTPGRIPYEWPDDTRNWVESIRKIRAANNQSDLVKPQLTLRFATDTNYIHNEQRTLYGDLRRERAETKAVMNVALPGQRLGGVLNWNVNESIDQITSKGSFEALNCLPVSQRNSTLSAGLTGDRYSSTITATFVKNSLFVVDRRPGNGNIEKQKDFDGYTYREENVEYRTFAHQTFAVADASAFPNPAIPNDDDNDIPLDTEFPNSATGSGSYFVLIDNEVIRVVQKSGNTFYIPPGGRAVNGYLESHNTGATVHLLGYAPYTGNWTGLGYLNVDDFHPQKSVLRPGTCIVSYEGYGDIGGLLQHEYDKQRSYQFTGYWFVSGLEPSYGEDGVPRVRVNLEGPGYMYDAQNVSPDMLQRIKNQFGRWRVGGQSIWKASGHNRDIPGDWVDFNTWDPSLKDSYPMKIKTRYAQNKEFLEHMWSTEFGKNCLICRAESEEFYKTHEKSWKTELAHQRAIGKHIYKESIRVLEEDAGPIKTYIRLIATIAAAAWDHPAQNTELAQRFTKIPNTLFDNIRNIYTGLIFDGQYNLDYIGPEETTGNAQADAAAASGFRWWNPTYDDAHVLMRRIEITCPFESTYDKAPFSQPMVDLAEVNDSVFWINREGYPVFVPRLWPLRPPKWGKVSAAGYRDLNKAIPYDTQDFEWFMAHGASIQGYSHSVDTTQALTQTWVTAKDAFDGQFTIAAGGTGVINGKRINYSPLAGNKEGLALTSGVQKVDTVSMENVILGLDWNTDPSAWGVVERRQGEGTVIPKRPALYNGVPKLYKGKKGHPGGVRRVQTTVNFFFNRFLIKPVESANGKIHRSLTVDGKFGPVTELGVKAMQRFIQARLPSNKKPTGNFTGAELGEYQKKTRNYLRNYFELHEEFLRTDIWHYVYTSLSQEEAWAKYVAAVTGIPVPMTKNTQKLKYNVGNLGPDAPEWIIDDKGLQKEVAKWQKGFAKTAVNAGNRKVDDAINRATVRSIQSGLADPRVQPGDVIWAEVPGFLGLRNSGNATPPFTNGIYVTNISRQMDLMQGVYTATYSGHRYRGEVGIGLTAGTGKGYNFIKE